MWQLWESNSLLSPNKNTQRKISFTKPKLLRVSFFTSFHSFLTWNWDRRNQINWRYASKLKSTYHDFSSGTWFDIMYDGVNDRPIWSANKRVLLDPIHILLWVLIGRLYVSALLADHKRIQLSCEISWGMISKGTEGGLPITISWCIELYTFLLSSQGGSPVPKIDRRRASHPRTTLQVKVEIFNKGFDQF